MPLTASCITALLLGSHSGGWRYDGFTAHRGGAIEHTMRRLASRTQRDLLAIIQDFKCAICGSALPNKFECDHLVPFSKGGETTLQNLQALCPSCHSNKTREQAKGA